MATATKQDDDLLIIADEESSSDSSGDIEFSFDFGDTETSSTSDTNWDVMNSQEEISSQTQQWDSKSEEILDISLDESNTWDDSNSFAEKSKQEISSHWEEKKQDEDFSFDLTDTSSPEILENEDLSSKVDIQWDSPETPASIDDVAIVTEDSMNDILSATIAKLAARKEVIAVSKADKVKKEEEIKAQIADLQSQVSQLEAEMKDLDIESDKITANIAELENMKLDPVKEHNTKRSVKK